MELNLKTLGYMLVLFSVILLVILVFVKIDADNKSELLCDTFSQNGLDMTGCPAHDSNVSWLLVSAFGIAFLMLGTGLYMIFMPAINSVSGVKREFKEVDLSKLDEEEKKIYDIIKAKEGSIYQTDLIKETDFSKVKMSRLLDKMEQKGILERKRRGMTNIVVLK